MPLKLSNAAASLALAATLAASLGTAPAQAQSADARAAMNDPTVKAAVSACKPDRQRLCSDVWAGGGRIVRCLAEKSAQLSPGCRTSLEQARDALVAAGIVKPEPVGPQ